VIVAAVVGFSGCVWPSFGFGPDRAGFNPLERSVGTVNVRDLALAWSLATGTDPVGDPVVSGDRVLVAGCSTSLPSIGRDARVDDRRRENL
jgi:hypothetical protein